MFKIRVCSNCGREFPLTTEFWHRDKGNCEGLNKRWKECRNGSFGIRDLSNLDYKPCKRCGEIFPTTTDYFRRSNKKTKDGIKEYLCNICKKCEGERDKRFKQDHKEEISKNRKEYYQNNIEKCRSYYHENKDRILARDINKRDSKVKYLREYYLKNKEVLLKKQKAYTENNIEDIRAYRKEYYKLRNQTEEGKAVLRKAKHKRRANQKNLPSNLTTQQWENIKETFNHSCAYCGNNNLNLHQEHFVPLNKGGEYTINNIIPACAHCNFSKQDKDFFEWYPKQKKYSEKREKFILDYLKYDKKHMVQQLALTMM